MKRCPPIGEPGRVTGGGRAAAGTRRGDLGVRLIVIYKALKGAAELLAALALLALAASGELERVRTAAQLLHEHVASRWSLLAGRALAALVTHRAVHLLELGLALDAAASAFEGWTLWRGFRWAPWVVVASTATPLPFEIAHLARAPHLGRAALLAVNAAIVVYLCWRIARRRGA